MCGSLGLPALPITIERKRVKKRRSRTVSYFCVSLFAQLRTIEGRGRDTDLFMPVMLPTCRNKKASPMMNSETSWQAEGPKDP